MTPTPFDRGHTAVASSTQRRTINLSQVSAGRHVGVKQVSDRFWLVRWPACEFVTDSPAERRRPAPDAEFGAAAQAEGSRPHGCPSPGWCAVALLQYGLTFAVWVCPMGDSEADNRADINIKCPVCYTALTLAREMPSLKVWVCEHCGASVTVPPDAWSASRDSGPTSND
jgi:ribosomal protein L37AE/L43A